MTAQQLADKIGHGMTRSVIANIESGRKTDLPSNQVLEIAWALGVSPVALLVDLSSPDDLATIGYQTRYSNRDLALWITGEVVFADPDVQGANGLPELNPGQHLALTRVAATREIYRLSQRRAYLERQIARQEEPAAKEHYRSELDVVLEQIGDAERRLRESATPSREPEWMQDAKREGRLPPNYEPSDSTVAFQDSDGSIVEMSQDLVERILLAARDAKKNRDDG